MKIIPLICFAILIGTLPGQPIVLTYDDIGDKYYDTPPAWAAEEKSWLGLFMRGSGSGEKEPQSRLGIVRLTYVPRKDSGKTVYQIATIPQGAALLVSGVACLAPGPVLTAGRFVDLWDGNREATFRLGETLYTLRLDFRRADHCDSVITITSGRRTQKLFDASESGSLACDDPHFRIHWAGDLDRDGRLDLVVTFSRKYSYFPRRLLLSSAGGSQDLVAEVARYERFAE